MNYEEKYKQALERARQFSEHPLQEDSASIVEYIFHELAETEGERTNRACGPEKPRQGFFLHETGWLHHG